VPGHPSLGPINIANAPLNETELVLQQSLDERSHYAFHCSELEDIVHACDDELSGFTEEYGCTQDQLAEMCVGQGQGHDREDQRVKSELQRQSGIPCPLTDTDLDVDEPGCPDSTVPSMAQIYRIRFPVRRVGVY